MFLDLDISLAQGQFAIQTYRKPQNAYLYIPRTSCHPKSVYTALIVGETQRLFRHNCQNAGRLRHHIGFFLRRLQLRGFSVAECSQLIEKTPQKLSLRKQKVRQENKFFFRQTYTITLNARWIQHALRRNWHVVQSTLKNQPNQFSHLGSRRISSGWISVAIGYFSMIPHRVWDEVEVWVFYGKTFQSFRCKVRMMLKKPHLIASAEHIFAQAARRVQFRTKRIAMGLWKSLLFAATRELESSIRVKKILLYIQLPVSRLLVS